MAAKVDGRHFVSLLARRPSVVRRGVFTKRGGVNRFNFADVRLFGRRVHRIITRGPRIKLAL